MWTPKEHQILSIIGPTGSGKTARAAQIATKWLENGARVAVISLDSRQIYAEFPALSVADLAIWEEIKAVYQDKIHVYNLASLHLHEDWSFGVLLAAAREQIQHSLEKHRAIILVGGTLVCHEKVLVTQGDFTTIPPDDNIRFAAENMSVSELQEWLGRVAPDTLAGLNPSDRANPRRLVRKIEIVLAHKLGTQQPETSLLEKVDQYWYLPPIDRENLREKVIARVTDRFHDPTCRQEVHRVLVDWPDILTNKKLLSRTPLGFIPLAQLELGQTDTQTALKTWQHDEWHYAKHQLTWCEKLVTDHHTHLIDERELFPD